MKNILSGCERAAEQEKFKKKEIKKQQQLRTNEENSDSHMYVHMYVCLLRNFLLLFKDKYMKALALTLTLTHRATCASLSSSERNQNSRRH